MRRIFVGDLRIGEEERRVINQVLDSGRISEHTFVRRFETEFARKLGARHCVLVSSGTAALIAGITALIEGGRIPRGTKVITSPLTYIATSNAIKLCGLEPVYVDVDPQTFNITPEHITSLLSWSDPSDYSMILPVHLNGFACDMNAIMEIARQNDLVVFEDAAQAHGTRIEGKTVGTFGLVADYSFYIAHNIQAGEMGAVVTSDGRLAKLVRKIKANGRLCDCVRCTRHEGICPFESDADEDLDPRFTHDIIGYNFKTMEFQAAIGTVQIDKMDEIIRTRYENVRKLNQRLSGLSDRLQFQEADPTVSYLGYIVLIKEGAGIKRGVLRRKLEEAGIETRPLYGCIPTQQPAYADLKEQYTSRLPVAEYAGRNGFYIGCHQYLDDEDIEYIGQVFERLLC